ncbi:hypothetical protein N7499_002934 [Penicillium canescens]|uniref:Uncharacterized protein n=1 Tax=Penicillium canescens TaxID=5083 RepID=A0AAD6HYG5_PENCN|nr:uncharacterized protein N7446_014107 [Penicillium canescens]KAJ5981573.1 hypothetical protein N7522_013557 [Penicillium canescens]KAJ6022305.1 hypothetical protein N7460_014049 [Penicillium canescens]KAJ6038955.1 hypothetical protein N7446_014107 [Penicillium canescens]KAJ6066201.1 hypothetical protein N7444_000193 [Penicillium canescens]KAJ6094338.1 hypothetical protein N7499_002934 [Penicillium canescens]
MSFVDPSAQTFASLFDLVKSERNQYAIEPKHQPSKSQVQCFGRNCALLKEQPDPATKGRTSRERDEKARANVREMIKRFPSDLLVLSLLKIPKTKLSNLQDKWIGKIMEWWAGEDKPENLSKVALALCQHFKLIYRRQEEGNSGVPSDQPIQTIVSLERDEFLHILDSCETTSEVDTLDQSVDYDIRALAPILRRAGNSPNVKMICPWYGGPSVEVTLKIDVSLAFGERLVRYRVAHAPGQTGLKNQTDGFP